MTGNVDGSLDNSEWMRNGDYVPTRMEAVCDAANTVTNRKIISNPENTVGVMSLAGKGPELLVSPTEDVGKIMAALHDVKLFGKLNFLDGVQVAHLALKHRRNKNGGQRLIVFVGSPGANISGLTRLTWTTIVLVTWCNLELRLTVFHFPCWAVTEEPKELKKVGKALHKNEIAGHSLLHPPQPFFPHFPLIHIYTLVALGQSM